MFPTSKKITEEGNWDLSHCGCDQMAMCIALAASSGYLRTAISAYQSRAAQTKGKSCLKKYWDSPNCPLGQRVIWESSPAAVVVPCQDNHFQARSAQGWSVCLLPNAPSRAALFWATPLEHSSGSHLNMACAIPLMCTLTVAHSTYRPLTNLDIQEPLPHQEAARCPIRTSLSGL